MRSPAPNGPLPVRRGLVRFPPRNQLPYGVAVRKLPLVGTSWYERGKVYWLRRIGGAGLMALIVVSQAAMVLGAMDAIAPPGSSARPALDVGELAYTLWTGFWVYWRASRNAARGIGTVSRSSRSGAAAGAAGSLSRVCGGALAGVAVFASLFIGGLILAIAVMYLERVPPFEKHQRRLIAEQLRSAP